MSSTMSSPTMDVSLGPLDVSFFVLTLTISVLIGLYFANKNNTLEEYMLGGRDQKLWPVSVSMMTSFISGLTLIGNPAELYHHGATYSLVILPTILSVPFSALILLPVFYRSRSISVFNYLELRFSPLIKRITSLSFMFQMTLYNSVVLYVPSLSLQSILGISDTVSIGAVGLSCLIYCTLGGIKAVIWTDFFQAGLMCLSVLCICISGTLEAGGFMKLIDINCAGGRLSLDNFFNFDLTTRHTLFNFITGGVLVNVFMNGANQIQVQRALSLPTLRLGQWSQLFAALCTMLISIASSYIGLVLFANYEKCDPFYNHEIDKRDAILIYYVSTHLDYLPGLRGIFVAGIFAATLSTLSSFQNSMSALVIEDFIRPALKEPMSDKTAAYLGKSIALLFGIACVSLTFVVRSFSGLLQVAITLFGALGAPFIGAFMMGMLTNFTNTIGMLAGMLSGFALGVYIQLYQTFHLPALEPTLPLSTTGCPANLNSTLLSPMHSLLTEHLKGEAREFHLGQMSYLWLPMFAFILTLAVATVASFLTGGWNQQVEDKYLVSWLHRGDDSYEMRYKSQKEEVVGQIRAYINGLRKDQDGGECEIRSTKC